MKIDILITVIFLSILHGIIPSHWVPIMGLKQKYKWDNIRTFRIVSVLSFAHILSTVFIGILLALIGHFLKQQILEYLSIQWFSAIFLFVMGIYFIYKHYYHHHFHLYHEDEVMKKKNQQQQIIALIIAMFFSPCMEITTMLFVGGMWNWQYILIISLVYFFISFLSSIFWIFFFDTLSKKLNFHHLEHNSGLLAGASLIISAVLIFLI